ncbi:M24 family metallopeptidase [Anoxybacteroides tepidamans]|uniref:M24 family metallopeptidase n=1 Tax=Anoxybacteroides tepidamans TaxID=265948 RepID=UPI0018DC32FE|nr:M24 family metallopeptidase [Anoxybacillus tepidamans]
MIAETAIQKVRRFMDHNHLDGVLFRKRSNFAWLTGGGSNHIVNTTELGVADLLVFRDKVYCVTNRMEYARIRDEELLGGEVEFIATEWYEEQDRAIRELGAGKNIASDAPVAGLIDLSSELATLRFCLSEEEMEKYRWLGKKSAWAVESTCKEIEPGWTEHEIAAHLAAKVMKEGICPHVILVSTDDRVFKYRHPIPTSKKLEKYAMVVICAEKWGLIANATRFVHFGKLPQELEENKRKLARIDAIMNASTRPGVMIKDIFRQAVTAYEEAGFLNDWKYLHQGGPTGYATREFLATPEREEVVQLHQAFAWNPAIKGIKSEDTILVKENENEFLTHTGDWVYIETEVNQQMYLRPDILVK